MRSRRKLDLAAPLLVWAAAGCGDQSASSAGRCEDVELIVAASDYSRTVLCGAPGCVDGPGTTGADLGVDPQLASTNGRTFLLARDKDLVFEVDPACGRAQGRFSVHDLAVPAPDGTPRDANPHDVAAAPDGTLVVPLFTAARVAFVKDGKVEAALDLSEYDPDGNPQADAVSVVDVAGVPKAFVTLERLDDSDVLLRSKQSSQMLRIDVTTRTIEAAIDLEGRNPFNPMSALGGALFMAMPGNFESAEEDLAGIERFDTTTSTSKLLVPERALGGSVVEVAVTDGCGAAIVAGPEPNLNPTSLVTFDPETGRALATHAAPVLGPTPGYDLQALAWRGRTLYVGDRRAGPSGYTVRVLEDRGGCSVADTGRVLDLPLAPAALRAAR